MKQYYISLLLFFRMSVMLSVVQYTVFSHLSKCTWRVFPNTMREVTCQVLLNKNGHFPSLSFVNLCFPSVILWLEREENKKSILEMFQPFYLSFSTNTHSASTAYKAIFSYFIILTKVFSTKGDLYTFLKIIFRCRLSEHM